MLIALDKHIKQERLHVIVERLMVQKELGQEAQVLAVDLVLAAVHFKDGNATSPVNFLPGGMVHHAFHPVPHGHEPALHILEAELTHPQPAVRHARILFREWRLEPSVDVVRTKANHRNWHRVPTRGRGGVRAPNRGQHGRSGAAPGRHVHSAAKQLLGGTHAAVESFLIFLRRQLRLRVCVFALQEPTEWRVVHINRLGAPRRLCRRCILFARDAQAHDLLGWRLFMRRLAALGHGRLGRPTHGAVPEPPRWLVERRAQAVEVPPAITSIAKHNLLIVALVQTDLTHLALHAAPVVRPHDGKFLAGLIPVHTRCMSCCET